MTLEKIWIAGASGLVGRILLEKLLASDDVGHIDSFGRKILNIENSKLVQHIADFGNHSFQPLSPGLASDIAFCCLGTTIRKAGSRENFSAIDREAVVRFAKAAKLAGAKKFAVISSLGANSLSRVFYNRVKGHMENDLTTLGFDSLIIFRPSLLIGERSELRLGELLAQKILPFLDFFLRGSLAKYRTTSAFRLADYMLISVLHSSDGVRIFENNEILFSKLK